MVHDLHITHRRKPNIFASPPAGFPLWSTCLRSLAFSHDVGREAGDEFFTQVEAYRFLLQVICGLQSPILGETEVFGQFKKFTQEWLAMEPRRTALVQRLLSDAKAIRSQHLVDLGTQSYGSWVRANLRPERVHFLGAGQLVREIYPYLRKQERTIVIHLRDPRKIVDCRDPSEAVEWPVVTHPLEAVAFDEGALIVAAPLSSREILLWLGSRRPKQVIDLRDTSSVDALPFAGTVVLQDIFSHIEKTKQALLPRVQSAQVEIDSRSEQAAAKALMRPQGWDDLCA